MFTGFVDSDNIFVWQTIIVGPLDIPYYEGMFHVGIHFIEEYLVAPMKVNLFKFLTSYFIFFIATVQPKFSCLFLSRFILNPNWFGIPTLANDASILKCLQTSV